jgi:hypothetical protein
MQSDILRLLSVWAYDAPAAIEMSFQLSWSIARTGSATASRQTAGSRPILTFAKSNASEKSKES